MDDSTGGLSTGLVSNEDKSMYVRFNVPRCLSPNTCLYTCTYNMVLAKHLRPSLQIWLDIEAPVDYACLLVRMLSRVKTLSGGPSAQPSRHAQPPHKACGA